MLCGANVKGQHLKKSIAEILTTLIDSSSTVAVRGRNQEEARGFHLQTLIWAFNRLPLSVYQSKHFLEKKKKPCWIAVRVMRLAEHPCDTPSSCTQSESFTENKPDLNLSSSVSVLFTFNFVAHCKDCWITEISLMKSCTSILPSCNLSFFF